MTSFEEPRNRSMLAVVIVLVAILGLGLVGKAMFSGLFGDSSETTVASTATVGVPVVVEVPAGASARTIGSLLQGADVIASAREFERAVEDGGYEQRLGAGRYELTTGMSMEDVIATLLAGPAFETYRITVREGLRIGEVLTEISSQTPYTAGELEEALLSGAVQSSLLDGDFDTIQAWEGLLFPDTYEFENDASAAAILGKLAQTMETRVGSINWSPWTERGFTIYEGIVAASIIEAETKVDIDRPNVASVIVNRIELGMPLQIDATVLYALDARGIGLTLDDLEIDSPYNTYLNVGLPPTPIGGPRLASLEAIADPPATDYLYYVLTTADGSHSFTADYNEFLGWKDKAKAEGLFP